MINGYNNCSVFKSGKKMLKFILEKQKERFSQNKETVVYT
jgi:hypothetical protein